jgi:hypothetical protein
MSIATDGGVTPVAERIIPLVLLQRGDMLDKYMAKSVCFHCGT